MMLLPSGGRRVSAWQMRLRVSRFGLAEQWERVFKTFFDRASFSSWAIFLCRRAFTFFVMRCSRVVQPPSARTG